MSKTSIEWTGATWNPVHGCKAISPGCAHCYAEPMTARLEAMGQKGYAGLTKPGTGGKKLRVWSGEFREIPDALSIPLRAKKPALWFVNSMSDLFGEGVSNGFIASVFGVMGSTRHHTFQVLTKRASRLPQWFDWISERGNLAACTVEMLAHKIDFDSPNGRRDRLEHIGPGWPWPLPNVWLGVSVEDRKHGLPRIDDLRKVPAAVRFLSIEPLLEDLGDLSEYLQPGRCQAIGPAPERFRCGLHKGHDGTHTALMESSAPWFGKAPIDWVIVGGESGHGARPFDLAWARSIVAQCKAAGVPCFVKQLGANPVTSEEAWRASLPTPMLNHRNHARAPDEAVPLLLGDKKGGDPSEWPADLRVREMPRAT